VFYMVLSATVLYGSFGVIAQDFRFPTTDAGWFGVFGVGLGYKTPDLHTKFLGLA